MSVGPTDPNSQYDLTTEQGRAAFIAANGGAGALTAPTSGTSARSLARITGQVFMGAAPTEPYWTPHGPGEPHVSDATESGAGAGGHLTGLQDVNTAKLSIRSWSPNAQAAFAQSVYKMGLVQDPNNWLAVVNVWETAVDEAANWNAAGVNTFTPENALPLLATGSGKHLATTTTATSSTKPTALGAESVIKTIFQHGLGRDPNKKELAKFTGLINDFAAKHPSVTTQTADGFGNTNTSTQPGVGQGDYEQLTQDQVQTTPEYGAYQAATTYYNALQDLLHNG
jgi:hypothetical protein